MSDAQTENKSTNQPTNQQTNCMELSPWEANSSSASQEIPRV